MKLFAVSSKVRLTERPAWFDAFYKKYGGSSDYHITLKQTCFLPEEAIEEVKTKLHMFFHRFSVPNHRLELIFNRLVIDDGALTKTIMLHAEPQPILDQLQKGIISTLAMYREYAWKEAETWESDFKPHLTIASDLDPTIFADAIHEIGEEKGCKGVIKDVALIIVEKMIPEEADKAENQTIYHF